MNSKIIVPILLAGLAVIAIGGWYAARLSGDQSERARQAQETEVRILVQKFGSSLKNVPLQSSKDILAQSMEENYANTVSPDLIARWINDPSHALGRAVSSPWPERIEISSIDRISDAEYRVKGDIIEMTSAEQTDGGVAARQSVELILRSDGNRLLITDALAGSYDNSQEAMIRGSYGCLPAKIRDTGGRSCALGIRADDGSYYALDTSGMPQTVLFSLKAGERVSALGILTLPGDATTNIYTDVRGILKAQSIIKL